MMMLRFVIATLLAGAVLAGVRKSLISLSAIYTCKPILSSLISYFSFFFFSTIEFNENILSAASYIEVCGRRNPELDKCVLNSVSKLKSKFSKGIPELDAPSLEPLTLNKLVISDAPTFKAIAQNVKLWGFPAFKVQNLHVDLKEQLITIDISFDTIGLEAEYDVSTRIVVPIVGKGPINIVAGKT